MWERSVHAVNKSDAKRTNGWHTGCWARVQLSSFGIMWQGKKFPTPTCLHHPPSSTAILWLLSCSSTAEERALWSPSLENWMFFIFKSTQLLCCTRAKKIANAIKKKVFLQCAIGFFHQVTENFQEESVNLSNCNSHICTKIYVGTQVKELRSIFAIRIKSAM